MNLNLMVFIQEIIYLKQRVGAYIINLEKNESLESHWVALYVNAENLLYFTRFRVKHIGKKITILIGNKNINANTYKMQVFDSVMCGYFCFFQVY